MPSAALETKEPPQPERPVARRLDRARVIQSLRRVRRQVAVHLRYFLHIDLKSTPRDNLLALAFAAVLIFLMVGGTLWIMLDLNARMAM